MTSQLNSRSSGGPGLVPRPAQPSSLPTRPAGPGAPSWPAQPPDGSRRSPGSGSGTSLPSSGSASVGGAGGRPTSRRQASNAAAVTSAFFFQADDGIRAGRVTGVQTCALPISPRQPSAPPAAPPPAPAIAPSGSPHAPRDPLLDPAGTSPAGWPGRSAPRSSAHGPPPRSEERRVGKEGRSRWTPDHGTRDRSGQ